MKISKILHKAADKYLWDGFGSPPNEEAQNEIYSCLAIHKVLIEKQYANNFVSCEKIVSDFLKKMGLRTYSNIEFAEFKNTEEAQGARYLWLKFAALVAEDEGL